MKKNIIVAIPFKRPYGAKVLPGTEYSLYFDGCSKGNPGAAGIGASLVHDGQEIWAASSFLGEEKTNNEAEYSALIYGLEKAIELEISTLTVYGDSLLVINQVSNKFKVKSRNLFSLHEKVIQLKSQFEQIFFVHIPREMNQRADELANFAVKCCE